MDRCFIEEQTLDKKDYTTEYLEKGDYEYCTFIRCDFSNSDLSGVNFLECTFTDCNLTMVKLEETAFRDTRFNDCKMLGLHFESCNKFGFGVRFEKCTLDHASFYQVKMKNTSFTECRLKETDFTETDLTGSVFDNCDLTGTTFHQTLLQKANFTTSYNYIFDPEENRLKNARFSLSGLPGLLQKYGIRVEP